MEADLFTLRNPADADLIDGSIGEGSPFHQTFGYYAHGVAVETAVLPAGWQGRLVPVRNSNTGGGTGLCLEVHDLAVSKLVAGREKDVDFLRGFFGQRYVSKACLNDFGAGQIVTEERRQLCLIRLRRLLGR